MDTEFHLFPADFLPFPFSLTGIFTALQIVPLAAGYL